jgi:hypothetical protein
VYWLPWSVLKISGRPLSSASSSASMQKLASSRLDRRNAISRPTCSYSSATLPQTRSGLISPKFPALVRGRLEKFSIERLCDFLRALGCDVQIHVINKKQLSPGKLTIKMAQG